MAKDQVVFSFYLKILVLFYFNIIIKNEIYSITKLELTEFIKNVAKLSYFCAVS